MTTIEHTVEVHDLDAGHIRMQSDDSTGQMAIDIDDYALVMVFGTPGREVEDIAGIGVLMSKLAHVQHVLVQREMDSHEYEMLLATGQLLVVREDGPPTHTTPHIRRWARTDDPDAG